MPDRAAQHWDGIACRDGQDTALQCPVCGGASHRKVAGWRESRLSIIECTSCHLWSTSGLAEDEYDAGLVSKFDPTKPAIQQHERIRQLEYKKISRVISERRPLGGRLLDVGAGSGGFLRTHLGHAAAVWDVLGVDCAHRVDVNHGFRMIAGTIADVPPVEKFDVIVLLDVLCQMADPRGDLIKARRLLNPGGLVIIEEANVALTRRFRVGPLAWLRTGRWNTFVPGFRRSYFNTLTLSELLVAAGFRNPAALPGHLNRGGSKWNSIICGIVDAAVLVAHRWHLDSHLSPRVIVLAEAGPA